MSDETPTIFRVPGEVDFLVRDSLRESLGRLVDAPVVILDFTGTDYMDSSGISQVLLFARARRRAGRSDPRLVVGPGVARLFDVAGVSTLVPIFSSIEAAQAG